MISDAESDYHARAVQLARQLQPFCRAWPSSEFPVFHPSNENGWAGACDALARLGVMEKYPDAHGPVVAHRFTTHWMPGEPLRLHRHPGEPSYTDLLRSLCNFAAFENLDLRAIGIDRFKDGSSEAEFIEDLATRNLGSWSANTGFQFNDDQGRDGYVMIDSDYWDARKALAVALGSFDALYPPSDAC